MTDKTMPERIYAWGGYDIPRWSSANVYEGTTEYVRADIAQGDVNDPLEDGQWRWTKQLAADEWTPRKVIPFQWSEGSPFILSENHIDAEMFSPDGLYSIGPVIRPPEDV